MTSVVLAQASMAEYYLPTDCKIVHREVVSHNWNSNKFHNRNEDARLRDSPVTWQFSSWTTIIIIIINII